MTSDFLGGVIEGFYGRPWTTEQRHRLFRWMQAAGLDAYLYCPKDDLKHRTAWRLPYSAAELAGLQDLVQGARRRGIRFLYGIAPGLDLEHGSARDEAVLRRKVSQLTALGVGQVAVLFDDIAPRLGAGDRRKFGTVAGAQAAFVNRFRDWLVGRTPSARVLFCPTPYCARMCHPSVRESAYLREIGEKLHPEVDIFWTGPEIVSGEIPVAGIGELAAVLRRPPVIWDNLHANDYDLRRIYLGPYLGRSPELRGQVRGILTNPNCEFELNYLPIRSLGDFLRAGRRWEARRAWNRALEDWLAEFRCAAPGRLTRRDLELLGHCFWLPQAHGPRAAAWLEDWRASLGPDPAAARAARPRVVRHAREVEALFARLTGLLNRELLHALYRHAWELKEEAILQRRFSEWLADGPAPGEEYVSGEHLPGTYRGGLAADLQRELPLTPKGGFARPGRWAPEVRRGGP